MIERESGKKNNSGRSKEDEEQVSPYVNLIAAVRTGKRSMRNVYMSRKQSRKASSTTSKEQEVEDIGVAVTEADREGTMVMAVVVPVAAANSLNDGVGGIHGTLGHSEEELLAKTKPGSEETTAAESCPIGAAGDAPIHQGGHNMCALVGAMHTAEEPIIVRVTDTPTTVHGTSLPITQSHNLVSLFHTLQLSPTVELHVCIRTHPLVVVYPDNHGISYSIPRHTVTDAVASTYTVYHNHECGVTGYVVQV
ncbi:hypothetical protein Cgig2_032835 [Carnegiea gigantea]|uniref:Uncharacterized protein n=1 Tax=Carnegiea gigantea TaxID=171969 RepID=A0A9Q1GVV3_9CARY|nr:hypothetical protein Cgig2_032835 [Carnegiea gigantea]